jgi:WD40 repeat protein
VNAVTYSPDGTRIATASDDKTAQIWDATTGWHLTTLRGHEYRVTAVTYSPDGTRIATASDDNTARTWDLASLPGVRTTLVAWLRRRPVVSSSALHGHQAGINDVAFTADGEGVVTASDDGTIRIWRLPGQAAEHVLTGHAAPVTGIALRPDGRFLASASGDGTVRIWSLETAAAIATLIPLPEGGYAALLPDGSYKLDGNPGDHLWWAMKLVRFAPGELDPYVPRIRRLPAGAPILPPG